MTASHRFQWAGALVLAWAISCGGVLWQVRQRERRYDELLVAAAGKEGVDPFLLKALAWRASGFDARKIGENGGRGLLQIREADGKAWAGQARIENFMFTDLLDARTNLEAGAWKLAQALKRYGSEAEALRWVLGGGEVEGVLRRREEYARRGW